MLKHDIAFLITTKKADRNPPFFIFEYKFLIP